MLLGARSFAQLATWFASSSRSLSLFLVSAILLCVIIVIAVNQHGQLQTKPLILWVMDIPWLAQSTHKKTDTHTKDTLADESLTHADTLRHTHSNRNSMPACKRNHYYFGVDLQRVQWQWHTKAYAHTYTWHEQLSRGESSSASGSPDKLKKLACIIPTWILICCSSDKDR